MTSRCRTTSIFSFANHTRSLPSVLWGKRATARAESLRFGLVGGAYTTVAYRHAQDQNGFFRFDIETPGEAVQSARMNWQQILVKEFKDLWEAEWQDDRLIEVAGWFGFEHIELLISELTHANLVSVERDEDWYRSFLARLGC